MSGLARGRSWGASVRLLYFLWRSHGKPAPSHARALLFRRWGLARRASRKNLPGEASATAMANPRRRSRTLRYFGAGGWPVRLPETSFRATQSGGILEAAAAYAARSPCRNTGGPDYQGRGPGQGPQWPFYQPEADKLRIACGPRSSICCPACRITLGAVAALLEDLARTSEELRLWGRRGRMV